MNAIEVAALSKTYSGGVEAVRGIEDRKSTRLNSSHLGISYAVFCLKKKKNNDEKGQERAQKYVLPIVREQDVFTSVNLFDRFIDGIGVRRVSPHESDAPH